MAAARKFMHVAAALCLGFALSGCANGQFEMDPAYWFPDNKKKLPGERREVFPGGVPGVTQGVPPELVRGSAAQQADQQALAPVQQQQAPQPQAEEQPKPRPKKVARPRPAPEPEPEPQVQPAPRAWPAPPPQAQQQQQQVPAAAWPAPPAPGTFTR
jgi:hypothetical protein